MESVYTTKSPQKTIELGKKLAGRLRLGDIVLLFGELGSGKTHFIKGIADGFGISAVIKSPTYAYVNKYELGAGSWERGASFGSKLQAPSSRPYFYHYDLYRFEEGDDISSIGFEETLDEPNAVNVVEWADRLGDDLPDKYISVSLEGSGPSTSSGTSEERSIKIKFISPTILTEDKIEEYYEEWGTPIHVREHSKKVAEVAMKVAQAYIDKGEIVNLDLLYPACMLHDVNRVCDFKEIDRDRFEEEVTDEKWEKWLACRREYKGMHHADIAANILKERGFTETAELIRLHKSINIVEEPDSYDTLEKQIIYYADKRVKHREIVDLKERFRDGKERYGKFDSIEDRKLFDEVERRTFELEEGLNISYNN